MIVPLLLYSDGGGTKKVSTYALKGGFSGTSSMVPSSPMKYRGGAQYADLSWATPQLVHFDLSKSSEVDFGEKAKKTNQYSFAISFHVLDAIVD